MLQDQIVEPTERWKTITDDAGRMFRKNLDTGRMELVTGALKPGEQFVTGVDEFGRRIKTNLATGEETQVSAAPPERLTLEQKKELKRVPTDIERGGYWKNTTTGHITWVDKGVDPPEGYDEKVPETRIREVSDLPERSFAERVAKDVAAAERKLTLTPEDTQYRPYIEFVNKNSTGITGYIWVDEVRKGLAKDIHAAVPVKLPKVGGVQVTMADVRAIAKDAGITIEEVLEKYRERTKPKFRKPR